MESENSAEAEAQPPEPKAAPEQKKKKEGLWETLRFVLTVVLFAILIRTFIAAPFSIPSGSMLPRLMIGDYLFVSKWPYGYSRYSFPFGLASFQGRVWGGIPERGDVVVFRYPGANEDWVKRVIGLPGDMVEIRGGEVILNGRALQRRRIADYVMPVSANSPCRRVGADSREVAGEGGARACAYPRYRETLPDGTSYEVLDQGPGRNDDRAPVRVPDGHLFVMGDNRDDSEDGRVPLEAGGVGMLPTENVLGRVLVTFFSTDGTASYWQPWTWFSAARWDRIGNTG
ncbi:MAG TPA: signal peptidase I [Allosphingosinicella sp.]|jgi:signal peptidase I